MFSPRFWFIRKSNGPFWRSVNPRCLSSICGLETPMSASTPVRSPEAKTSPVDASAHGDVSHCHESTYKNPPTCTYVHDLGGVLTCSPNKRRHDLGGGSYLYVDMHKLGGWTGVGCSHCRTRIALSILMHELILVRPKDLAKP